MAQRRGRSWVCPAWGPLAAAGTWVWGQVEDLVKQLGPPGNESQRAHTGYPLHPAFLLLSPRGHRQHRADAGSQNPPRPPGASLQLPAGVSLAPSPGNMIQATPSAPVMTLTALRPPCTWEPRKCLALALPRCLSAHLVADLPACTLWGVAPGTGPIAPHRWWRTCGCTNLGASVEAKCRPRARNLPGRGQPQGVPAPHTAQKVRSRAWQPQAAAS